MTTRLDQRGWTAAQDLAPCVRCNLPAIMRSCGHRGARPVTGPAPWRGSTSTRTTSKAKPSTASALHARAAAWRQLRNAPATELRTPARLWSARCAAAPGRKEMTSGRAIGVPLARVISGTTHYLPQQPLIPGQVKETGMPAIGQQHVLPAVLIDPPAGRPRRCSSIPSCATSPIGRASTRSA